MQRIAEEGQAPLAGLLLEEALRKLNFESEICKRTFPRRFPASLLFPQIESNLCLRAELPELSCCWSL